MEAVLCPASHARSRVPSCLEAETDARLPSLRRSSDVPPRGAPTASGEASDTNTDKERRVSFSPTVEVREYIVAEEESEITSLTSPSPEPTACSPAAPIRAQTPQAKKRGRPRDSPVDKAEKKTELAERLLEHAEKELERRCQTVHLQEKTYEPSRRDQERLDKLERKVEQRRREYWESIYLLEAEQRDADFHAGLEQGLKVGRLQGQLEVRKQQRCEALEEELRWRREKAELLQEALSLREELDILHARIETEARLRQAREQLAENEARLAEGEAYEVEFLRLTGII